MVVMMILVRIVVTDFAKMIMLMVILMASLMLVMVIWMVFGDGKQDDGDDPLGDRAAMVDD